MRVFCDGAGAEKTGQPGGWAFIILEEYSDTVLKEGSGFSPNTCSLEMELTAATEGLEAACRMGGAPIELITDSRIAIDVAKGAHFPRPAKYRLVSLRLRAAFIEAMASARWVKAHSGHRWNEEVDARAARARDARPETSKPRRRAAR